MERSARKHVEIPAKLRPFIELLLDNGGDTCRTGLMGRDPEDRTIDENLANRRGDMLDKAVADSLPTSDPPSTDQASQSDRFAETEVRNMEREASRKPCRKAIQELAYILWDMRGRPEGDSTTDWLRAERKLTEALTSGGVSGFDRMFVKDTSNIAQLLVFARMHCR
jgi:hypothetical protein